MGVLFAKPESILLLTKSRRFPGRFSTVTGLDPRMESHLVGIDDWAVNIRIAPSVVIERRRVAQRLSGSRQFHKVCCDLSMRE